MQRRRRRRPPRPRLRRRLLPTANSVAAFDGDTIQTKYGPVQVQAQIQDGSLVAVAIVQYPDDDGKSVRINQRALPELQSEALTAQSAQVDTVSGATYTSNAYVEVAAVGDRRGPRRGSE